MLAILGGESGCRMLDGPNRASAKNVRESSDKVKQDQGIERADTSTHTTETPFLLGCKPTDVHSRRLVPDDQSQPASKGLARIASIQVG